jgi:hypothetical protein
VQSVSYRDALRFRLPKNWTAEYLKSGALFREPTGVGVLMLDVVDFDAPKPVTTEDAVDLLASYGRHEGREILHLKNGSAFVTYVESGHEVVAFAWEIVHPIADGTLRLAMFSFTVKSGAENESEVATIVSMLTKEIASAEFIG